MREPDSTKAYCVKNYCKIGISNSNKEQKSEIIITSMSMDPTNTEIIYALGNCHKLPSTNNYNCLEVK